MNRSVLVVGAFVIGAALVHVAGQETVKLGGYVRSSATGRRRPAAGSAQRRRRNRRVFLLQPKCRTCASIFRKRALKPGSGIGYHRQAEDEIYYVLSGRGMMTLDGKEVEVGPGTAILTRTGSSHGLKVLGNEDLVIIINYLQEPGR